MKKRLAVLLAGLMALSLTASVPVFADEAEGADETAVWSHAWAIRDGAGKVILLSNSLFAHDTISFAHAHFGGAVGHGHVFQPGLSTNKSQDAVARLNTASIGFRTSFGGGIVREGHVAAGAAAFADEPGHAHMDVRGSISPRSTASR